MWAAPTTLPALVFFPMTWPGDGAARFVDGVLELHGPAVRWCLEHLVPLDGGAAALTLGHVVIGRSAAALDVTRAHERVHVRQYERWGPFFIPAYFLFSAVAWARGRDPYRDNPFEREAYGDDGRT